MKEMTTYPIPELHVLRSQAHEYLVAQELVDRSGGKAYFSNDAFQQGKRQKYCFMYNALAVVQSQEEADNLRNIVSLSIDKLPEPSTGPVLFVEKDANEGQVWDVKYVDINGEDVFISCKLTDMEDKSYRFNTKGYSFHAVNDVLFPLFSIDGRAISVNGRILSYTEAIEASGLERVDIQKKMIRSLYEILIFPSLHSADYNIFQKLIKERFIGVGGFWKINQDAKAIFYPKRADTDILYIDAGSITTQDRHIKFRASLEKEPPGSNLFVKYEIDIRVKLKTNPGEKVTVNQYGVGGWGATVKVTLL